MTPEDRAAVDDVLALYCERIDEYDVDGVAALFAPDCVVDFGPGRGGVIRGRDEVRARIARGQAAFRRTHHQLGQSRCTLEADGRVGAVTYATASHETWDGDRWRVGLRYVDVLARRRRRSPTTRSAPRGSSPNGPCRRPWSRTARPTGGRGSPGDARHPGMTVA